MSIHFHSTALDVLNVQRAYRRADKRALLVLDRFCRNWFAEDEEFQHEEAPHIIDKRGASLSRLSNRQRRASRRNVHRQQYLRVRQMERAGCSPPKEDVAPKHFGIPSEKTFNPFRNGRATPYVAPPPRAANNYIPPSINGEENLAKTRRAIREIVRSPMFYRRRTHKRRAGLRRNNTFTMRNYFLTEEYATQVRRMARMHRISEHCAEVAQEAVLVFLTGWIKYRGKRMPVRSVVHALKIGAQRVQRFLGAVGAAGGDSRETVTVKTWRGEDSRAAEDAKPFRNRFFAREAIGNARYDSSWEENIRHGVLSAEIVLQNTAAPEEKNEDERAEEVRKILPSLSMHQRSIVQMIMDGWTDEEIADSMGGAKSKQNNIRNIQKVKCVAFRKIREATETVNN